MKRDRLRNSSLESWQIDAEKLDEGVTAYELLNWSRQRCGTVEWAHDLMKNDFAARVLPSGRFGANAAWYRFNVLAFNLKVAMAKIGLPDFIRARPHTFRMRLLQVAGRVISHSRRLSMRMGAHGQFARDVLCGYERDLAVALA